ncbi:MAG: ABC transporter ATP-binding protein [Brevinema sp.]
MPQPLMIDAKNISLTYEIKTSFNLKRMFTKTDVKTSAFKVEALKNVSFTLEKGHNLGIIGTNGSGKSTLLRVIAQTFAPDAGEMLINTKNLQLLTLGAGFMESLTGRMNLTLNALLLGINKDDLDNGLTEEIIEFSELKDAIDYPMYTYSSGMKSRLTFSVAACIKPELLLLDEVFSVGDAHFQQKSQARIEEMIQSDKTVALISHDTVSLDKYCDKLMWLHLGEIKMIGSPEEILKEYLAFTTKNNCY